MENYTLIDEIIKGLSLQFIIDGLNNKRVERIFSEILIKYIKTLEISVKKNWNVNVFLQIENSSLV